MTVGQETHRSVGDDGHQRRVSLDGLEHHQGRRKRHRGTTGRTSGALAIHLDHRFAVRLGTHGGRKLESLPGFGGCRCLCAVVMWTCGITRVISHVRVSGRASRMLMGGANVVVTAHDQGVADLSRSSVVGTAYAKQHGRGREPLHRKGKGQQTYQDEAQAIEHDESVEQSLGEKFHHDMTLSAAGSHLGAASGPFIPHEQAWVGIKDASNARAGTPSVNSLAQINYSTTIE